MTGPSKPPGSSVAPSRDTPRDGFSRTAPNISDPDEPAEPESITDLVDAFLERERAEVKGVVGVLTFTQSVQAFIASSSWLGPEHMPAVIALRRIAGELDVEISAALTGQFGVTFRDLRAQAPTTADDDDPIERALRERDAK